MSEIIDGVLVLSDEEWAEYQRSCDRARTRQILKTDLRACTRCGKIL